jgi:hypothetical protein
MEIGSPAIDDAFEEPSALMAGSGGEKIETIPLHTLFGADGADFNSESGIDPRELIRGADVIMGVDVMSRRRFIVYGREFLEAATRAETPPLAGIIDIELDEGPETDDLERLLGLVEGIKGKHDYVGFEAWKKRRKT